MVKPGDEDGFRGMTRNGVPISTGYLLVDSTLCSGCRNCMLACSLVHEGKTSLSLSRIQVLQDILERFPDDISLRVCRQCEHPRCIEACPTEALHVDGTNGNVRTVNEDECNGCRMCIDACPCSPEMMVWHQERGVALKCDLCADTPHWNEPGGPQGKQACVEVCPVKALAFTADLPIQFGDEGYEVDLRQGR